MQKNKSANALAVSILKSSRVASRRGDVKDSEINQAVSDQRLDDSAGAGSKTGEGWIRRHHL
ncbi:hypothetical protein AJ78_06699 [Emergomyces pasteurianus Ep9510]|uniref:Uncharacterized protein n=1 Tax=Emergomyces pasteurianus Ep9510 TaxID=1447872 RepID=A0A1J9Q9A2_9EURO|nr:hypothetical protein AJ78_06699 [Emergomyces pasteurianus Ep9510]